jgi:hypothetical protein
MQVFISATAHHVFFFLWGFIGWVCDGIFNYRVGKEEGG